MDSPLAESHALAAPPPRTVVEVVYPPHRGRIGLRGSHVPLSWESTLPPTRVKGDRHFFELELPPNVVMELKLVRDEQDWAKGRNYTVHAGHELLIEPSFDRETTRLEPLRTLDAPSGPLMFEVLLPPTYDEQENKRYPVLYVMDGQSLWSTSQDPYGVWGLEGVLDNLYALNAISEAIVVGIHTADRRLERLSPVADAGHGGGEGPAFLEDLIRTLKPEIDARFRTQPVRECTGIMGSSMGGLFAFFAAWSRPDVFGKAACLSSSFWWADRFAVRLAELGDLPSPLPVLYVDSGASLNPHEKDLSVRDGFRHTTAMFHALTSRGFTPGVDLHRLVFAGHRHDPASWAARVAIPLQLLFPI